MTMPAQQTATRGQHLLRTIQMARIPKGTMLMLVDYLTRRRCLPSTARLGRPSYRMLGRMPVRHSQTMVIMQATIPLLHSQACTKCSARQLACNRVRLRRCVSLMLDTSTLLDSTLLQIVNIISQTASPAPGQASTSATPSKMSSRISRQEFYVALGLAAFAQQKQREYSIIITWQEAYTTVRSHID